MADGVGQSGGPPGPARSGRIFINQKEGTIEFYDESSPPRLVMKIGYCGLDDNGNPLYGSLMYDENGLEQFFYGKQVDGF